MNKKLTLSIDKEVIESAKEYAESEGRSLSNIVEEYLKSISKRRIKPGKPKFDKLIEELAGSVKLPKGKSAEELLTEAKLEKHLNR